MKGLTAAPCGKHPRATSSEILFFTAIWARGLARILATSSGGDSKTGLRTHRRFDNYVFFKEAPSPDPSEIRAGKKPLPPCRPTRRFFARGVSFLARFFFRLGVVGETPTPVGDEVTELIP